VLQGGAYTVVRATQQVNGNGNVLQGGAYTVVRATQQVNGNGNFGVSERNH